MQYILGFGIFSFVCIILEFIMLSVIDNSKNLALNKSSRNFFSVITVVLFVFYLLLTMLCLFISISYFIEGNISAGSKLLITSILVGISIYILFFKRLFSITKKKQDLY